MASPVSTYITISPNHVDWNQVPKPKKELLLHDFEDETVRLEACRKAIEMRIWSHITNDDQESSIFWNDFIQLNAFTSSFQERFRAYEELKDLLNKSRLHPNKIRRDKAYEDSQKAHIEFEKQRNRSFGQSFCMKVSFLSKKFIQVNFSIFKRVRGVFVFVFSKRF